MLGAIGFALGWRPDVGGLALGAVVIALGTAAFAAMGLLLGGTLRAEIVLARRQPAVVRLRSGSAHLSSPTTVPNALRCVARLTPSGALTEALTQALTHRRLVRRRGAGGVGRRLRRWRVRWFRFT